MEFQKVSLKALKCSALLFFNPKAFILAKKIVILGSIVLLGLTLRLTGLGWGLPNELHHASFNLDEEPILIAAFRVFPIMPRLNPHFFPHGTTQTYLISMALKVADFIGYLRLIDAESIKKDPTAYYRAFCSPKVYLVGRFLSVLMSTASILLVYFLGRSLFTEPVGFIAALILSIAPMDIVTAHFLKSDSGMVFWLVLSLLMSSRLFKRASKRRDLFLAGFFATLAATTKYTGAVAFIPLISEIIFSTIPLISSLIILLSSLISGIIIGMPCLLFAPSSIIHDIGIEFQWQQVANMNQGVGEGPRFLYYFTNVFYFGCRIPLLLLLCEGALAALKRRGKEDIFCFSLLAPYLFLLWCGGAVTVRYAIPLLPVLVIIAAKFVVNSLTDKTKWLRDVNLLIFILTLGYTLAFASACSHLMTEEDVRMEAYKEIKSTTRPNSRIGMISADYYPMLFSGKKFQTIGYDYDKAKQFDYLLLYGFEFEVPNHFKHRYLAENVFLSKLFSHKDFELARSFQRYPRFFGWRFDESYTVNDWDITHPTLLLFKNKSGL